MKTLFADMKKVEEGMNTIDTEDVEPMIYVAPMFNVLREDIRKQPFARADLLKGAPDSNEDSWIVPKVVK